MYCNVFILQRCGITDHSVGLYSKLDQTRAMYEEKHSALVNNIRKLHGGYITFAEEREQDTAKVCSARCTLFLVGKKTASHSLLINPTYFR